MDHRSPDVFSAVSILLSSFGLLIWNVDQWPLDIFKFNGGLPRPKFVPLPGVASGREVRKLSAG